ncbi:MAG: DUF3137 domain-containing protein [Pseudomonadota bacterium]
MKFFSFGNSKNKDCAIDAEFVETGVRDAGFAKFYDEKIRPAALDLEKIRLKYRKNFLIWMPIATIASAIVWIAFYHVEKSSFQANYGNKANQYLFGFCCIISVGFFYMPYRAWSEFKSKIKSGLFINIFSFFQFSFDPEGKADRWALPRFNILPYYDKVISQDLVLGKYKNVDLGFSELCATVETRDLKGRKNIKQVFRGAVVIFDFNKNFKGHTLVKDDKGFLGNMIQKTSHSDDFGNLSQVELEDPEFEKMFQVYSSDQIEARYLLTTAFMERLKKLSCHFESKKVEASFHQGSLLLIFHGSKNLFEPNSLLKKMDVAGECKKIIEQISLLFDIVDVLKIDERTGL